MRTDTPIAESTDVPKRAHRTPADGPWFWINKAAYERALSAGGATAAQVYLGLCRRQSDAADAGKIEFFASIQNVARAAGISSRAVAKYIPLLEKAGLVCHISGRHAGDGGAHTANRWVLVAFITKTEPTLMRVGHKHVRKVRKLVRAKPDSGANKEEVPRHISLGTTSTTPAATDGLVGPSGRVVAQFDPKYDAWRAGIIAANKAEAERTAAYIASQKAAQPA